MPLDPSAQLADPGDRDNADIIDDAAEVEVTRWFRWGAAIGVLVFLVVLTGGRTTLLSWVPGGDFYDSQADSFLDGRLDIDAERLGIEAFGHDGESYMYQPPWPAVLRLPVAAMTERFDGRLGQISMLLALLVALSATRRILVEARRAMRLGPSTALERAMAFGLGLVVAAGSVPMFLASRAWVYHESAIWGLAWTLLALALLLRHRADPGWASLAAVFGATFGAVASRASVGAGACAALGLCAVASLVLDRDRPLRHRLGGPAGAGALLLVAAIPSAAYAGLNVAKFGTVASIPFEEQAFTEVSPSRQAMLDENDGTLFGPQFAPTTLVHYLRPVGGLDVTRQFPFVDFPAPGGPVVGDVTFDLVDRTASIPLSLPALFVGALAGLWTLARRRCGDVATWAAVAVGASVGSVTIIPFGFIAQRYLADTMPFLVVLTTLGIQSTVRAVADRSCRTRRRARVGAWAMLIVLVPMSVFVNSGLATMYQRLYVPTHDPDLVRGLVDARTRLGASPTVLRADVLPAGAHPHDVVVVGDCDAVYIWDGTPIGEFRADAWVPAERTEAAGHVRMVLAIDDLRPDVRHPLALAPAAGPTVVWIERRQDGSVVSGIDIAGESTIGLPVWPAGRDGLDVVLDPFSGEATVRLGDERIVSGFFPRGADVTGIVVGASGGIDGYAATTPVETAGGIGGRGDTGALCRALVSDSG
ncbi:MAG: hypothetical protein OSA99_06270 [Acidimicrobiales bacterium]|nr:hypothetical protein [Acidimicrobiales bacterium]